MEEEIPDYTALDEPVAPHRFKVSGEIYEAAPVMPAKVRKFLHEKIMVFFDNEGKPKPGIENSTDDLAEAFGDLLDMLLLPESAARFVQRLDDRERPISNDQIMMIANGLLSHYGGRPTSPSSSLNDGRPSEVGSLTDTALTEESIHTGSATLGI